jgi:chloramphenicol-sensitive protein RarD
MNKGYAVILTGYIGWGLFPLYWTLLNHVPASEVLLHRMLWSMPVLLLLVMLSRRRRSQFKGALRSWHELRWLAVSSLVICANWGIYIWAVANHRVVEASMGYFLTPLLNVLAGVVVFREKLSRLNIAAILFAAAGVAYYVLTTATVPWVGIAVGISFAAYGLMRKQMKTNAVPGLLVEILLLLPFTLALLLWQQFRGEAMFLHYSWDTDLLLIMGGPITIIPLAFFTAGTRMLPMTTVGILFYVTPSLQFLSGVLLLGESFNVDKLFGFIGIWIGLAIFSYSLLTRKKIPQTTAS